ncbi:MAG: hypothetical protein M1818_008233 [Claussenomyces sp. TS43310]|nr:MAG: hypothetical protein M1818_008233 [Claussenomyces sp. TS43310]
MSLIIDDRTEALWIEAQTKPEWATTLFWEYVLKEQFFSGRDWTISSQQPPTNEASDLRRVDLRIQRWNNKRWNTILFFEAKKQNCSQAEIDTLEGQAYEACVSHMRYTGREEMYAVTAIGTSARLWVAVLEAPYLMPFVPLGVELSDRTGYIEAHSTDAAQLRDGFATIVKYDKLPEKKLKVLRSNISPRSFQQMASSWGSSTRNEPMVSPIAKGSSNYDTSMPQSELGYGSSSTAQAGIRAPAAASSSYSYNISQARSGFPAASLGSSVADMTPTQRDDTTLAESLASEDEDEEMYEPNEPVDVIHPDASFVEITRKVVEHNFRKDEIFFCFGNRETTKESWKRSKVGYEGVLRSCVVYTSRSGSQYWTWELPRRKEKGKRQGKGKEKGKGTGRA